MTAENRPVRVRRERTLTETLLSITLGLEAAMLFFAALVIFGLDRFSPDWLALVWGGVGMLVLVAVSRVQRHRWGVGIGAALQLALIATGFIEPTMFFVGAVFAALWIFCFVRGRQIDAQKAAWLAEHAAASETDTETSSTPREGETP